MQIGARISGANKAEPSTPEINPLLSENHCKVLVKVKLYKIPPPMPAIIPKEI